MEDSNVTTTLSSTSELTVEPHRRLTLSFWTSTPSCDLNPFKNMWTLLSQAGSENLKFEL